QNPCRVPQTLTDKCRVLLYVAPLTSEGERKHRGIRSPRRLRIPGICVFVLRGKQVVAAGVENVLVLVPFGRKCLLSLGMLAVLASAIAHGQSSAVTPGRPSDGAPPARLTIDTGNQQALVIPRLARSPNLEDFLSMLPEGDIAPQMARITHFIQR